MSRCVPRPVENSSLSQAFSYWHPVRSNTVPQVLTYFCYPSSEPHRSFSSGLETGRCPQVNGAPSARSAHNAERRVKHVRVRESPSRVIQNVVEARKKLKTSALLDTKRLGHRHVPLERIAVPQEQ